MIAEKFELDANSVAMTSSMESMGLDSLAVFDLIFDIEAKFGITVSNDEVKIETVADVVALIDRLRQEQGKP